MVFILDVKIYSRVFCFVENTRTPGGKAELIGLGPIIGLTTGGKKCEFYKTGNANRQIPKPFKVGMVKATLRIFSLLSKAVDAILRSLNSIKIKAKT